MANVSITRDGDDFVIETTKDGVLAFVAGMNMTGAMLQATLAIPEGETSEERAILEGDFDTVKNFFDQLKPFKSELEAQ